jgi:hypothetical protein
VAVQAAERIGARTIIYRDQTPVAALVPITDIQKLEPAELAESEDALMSLCGTFADDAFVDRLCELDRTVLFRRPATAPSADAEVTRTGKTLRPPAPVPPPVRSRGRRS